MSEDRATMEHHLVFANLDRFQRVVQIESSPDRTITFFIDNVPLLALREDGFYVRDRKVEEPAEDQTVRLAFMEWARNRMGL